MGTISLCCCTKLLDLRSFLRAISLCNLIGRGIVGFGEYSEGSGPLNPIEVGHLVGISRFGILDDPPSAGVLLNRHIIPKYSVKRKSK